MVIRAHDHDAVDGQEPRHSDSCALGCLLPLLGGCPRLLGGVSAELAAHDRCGLLHGGAEGLHLLYAPTVTARVHCEGGRSGRAVKTRYWGSLLRGGRKGHKKEAASGSRGRSLATEPRRKTGRAQEA